jgi:hypothetical protein
MREQYANTQKDIVYDIDALKHSSRWDRWAVA